MSAAVPDDLKPYQRFTDEEYLQCDPLACEATLECRTVELRKARKNHLCYGLSAETHEKHGIQAGGRYRYERALVDGSFWGTYRLCLACCDAHLLGHDY